MTTGPQSRHWSQGVGSAAIPPTDPAMPVAGRGGAGRGLAASFPAYVEEQQHHAPIGLPRSLGVPPAGSSFRRARRTMPFELRGLPRIERASVRLWDLLQESFPRYLRSQGLNQAVSGFLNGILDPSGGESAGLTLEIQKKDDGSTESRTVASPEVTIGSHATSEVKLSGAAISRHHARIVSGDGGYQLVDQGSSNGTYLRGDRIHPGYAYPLRNDETFSVPGYEITCRWSEDPPAPKLESLSVSSVRFEDGPDLYRAAARNGVMAAFRIEPGGSTCFIEVDVPLASLLIARVMGLAVGQAPNDLSAGSVVPLRPLSEVEKGVLELLFIKLLDHIQQAWGGDAEQTLHLEGLYDVIDPQLKERLVKERTLVAVCGLDFDNRRDAARVLVPTSAMETLKQRFDRDTTRAGDKIEEIYARFRDLLGLVPVELSCRIGELRLTGAELQGLQIGTTCFPDSLQLAITAQAVEGTLKIVPVLAPGAGATVTARLVEFGPHIRFEVTEIHTGRPGRPDAEPFDQGSDMSEGNQGAGDETHEGVGMLESMPLPMVIELGRLQLTVRDLAALRPGQVLELGRGPQDPVNLVIENQLAGQGKLVDVEGEIGVQIVDLYR